MDEVKNTKQEDIMPTPEDLKESAMKCAEAERCFGIGKDLDVKDKLRKLIKKYMNEHPEHTFETREEWVRNMTQEQRKLYDSMEETKAFWLLYANIV